MKIVETQRLLLREFTSEDAPFILRLLNEPSWLQFIGDRKVRTLEDARVYLRDGPLTMYRKFGFGLYLVEHDHLPVGMCGLLKRDTLEEVDLGFAYLPEYWGKGFACEAAQAIMDYARSTLKIDRIAAITSPDNVAAAKLLNKLGMRFSRTIALTPSASPVRLFEST